MTVKAEYANIWTQGWKVGFDTKNPIFSEGGVDSFRELINCIVDPGGTILPRPPVKTFGRIPGSSEGLIYFSGALHTFLPAGTLFRPTTSHGSEVLPLYFDIPYNLYVTNPTYEIIEQGVFLNVPYAFIKHSRENAPGAAAEYDILLHVWDAKPNHPTYVQDPFAPTQWQPAGYPINPYGNGIGKSGSFALFNPVATEAASRIFASRADANVGYCGIGRSRCWNPYTAAELEKYGQSYYGRCTWQNATAFIDIPERLSNLRGTINKYNSLIVEKLQLDGTWLKCVENTDYTLAEADSPWVNRTDPVIRISKPASQYGDLIRARVCVLPEVSIIDKCTLNPSAGVIIDSGIVLFEGTAYPTIALSTPLAFSSTLLVGIKLTKSGSTYTAAPFSQAVGDVSTASITLYPHNRYYVYILATITTDGAGALLTTTAFKYPNILNEAWYTQKHVDNLNIWAGVGEAGFLASAAKEVNGNRVTALQAVKNRLCICYPQDTQLWDVEAAQSQNAFIDRYDFGTVNQTTLFYNRPVICTERGIRAFDLTGLNFQSLDDLNIGERVQALGRINVKACSFWPWYGSYVAFCELTQTDRYAADARLPPESPLQGSNTKYGFLILSYSKESEVAAWSWNPVADLQTMYFRMAAVGDRMYFRAGDVVYYLDADWDTDIIDDTDGHAFVQRAVTQFSHVGKPGTRKRSLFISKSGAGNMLARPLMNPADPPVAVPAGTNFVGHLVKGTTSGKRKIPFTMTGTALSVEMQSIDNKGMTVDSLSIDYKPLGK